MAQVLASTAKSVVAVAPEVPGSMKSAVSSLALAYCVRSVQASVPADTLPAVKAGVAMAMAVVEPSSPESSR